MVYARLASDKSKEHMFSVPVNDKMNVHVYDYNMLVN